MRTIQNNSKKYTLPKEDVDILKLIQKGVKIDSKIKELKAELDDIQHELTEAARNRRGDKTSVKLSPLPNDVSAVVTFRESYELSEKADKHEMIGVIGNLYDRFFTEKTVIKTTKELKDLMTGKTDYENDKIRSYLTKIVKKKETKPNVRFVV